LDFDFIEIELLRHGYMYIGRRSVVRQGSRHIIYLPLDQRDFMGEASG